MTIVVSLPSQAEKMIDEVKAAFKNNLPHLQWMDPKTREAAIDKANAVVDMIGFPKYILNASKLDEEYQKVRLLLQLILSWQLYLFPSTISFSVSLTGSIHFQSTEFFNHIFFFLPFTIIRRVQSVW